MPKITGSTVAEHREDVSRRLLDAFDALLGECGYEQLTLRDVAERAGISRSSIYNYHRDKHALLLAWSHDRVDRYLRLLDRELAGSDDPRENLRTVAVTVLSEFAVASSDARNLAATLPPAQRAALMDHITPIRDRLREILRHGRDAGVFHGDPDPETAADMVLACLDTQRLTLAAGGDLAAAVRRVWPFLTHGLILADDH